MTQRKYDVILFGASGYTGGYVVEEIASVLKAGHEGIPSFTWAVAGRSLKKLTETLDQVSVITGIDLKHVDKIEADTSDLSSLKRMAAQTSVVLNVVGPYNFYGEAVVKACIAEGTSHVDLAGELQFLESTQVMYDEEARAKGVYIVGACGFDSIPADCGVAYLRHKFPGDISSIECYVAPDRIDPKVTGPSINIGTWKSTIHFMHNVWQVRGWQRKLYTKPMPKPEFRAAGRWPLHYSEEVQGWCTPFPGTDEDIVRRSNYLLHTQKNQRPIQYRAYLKFPYLLACFGTALIGLVAAIFSQFKCGLQLLEKYAHIFSLGLVSHQGPTREQAENAVFEFHMTATGWEKKLKGPSEEHLEKPSKKLKLVVSGRNPGYRATAAMLLQAGLTILWERNHMPEMGGVFTPGVAFADTTLVDRLQKREIQFRLMKM